MDGNYRKTSWALCLWPGLPQLWWQGSWYALALAGGFALLVNLLLASTFVWTELFPSRVRWVGWTAATITWILTALGSSWTRNRLQAASPSDLPDLFPRALTEYLRGNSLEAENLLRDLLRRDAADVDARLMLAAVYRHSARWDAAGRELLVLERYERSAKWRREIAVERGKLEQAHADQEGATSVGEPDPDASANSVQVERSDSSDQVQIRPAAA
jgi:hypothetical protein